MHRAVQGGFTLAEAVVVIVIIGILSGILAVFIRGPVLNYRETVLRAEMTDIADLALRRMARDLRLALPNSIRVSADTHAIEFLQTKTGGRYLSYDDDVQDAALKPLDFNDTSKTSFMMLGLTPTGKQAIIPNSDYVVVNNLGIAPVDAYQAGGAQSNIALITAVSADATNPTISLSTNPFAAQLPPMPSPSSRFQVVSGPVTYYCVPGAGGTGTISRQWQYPISAVQLTPPVPVGTPASNAAKQSSYIAKHISSCKFEYVVDSNRGALVRLTLGLEYTGPSTSEPNTIQLVHQIHVDNTP